MLDIKIVNGKLLNMDQNRLIEAELGIKDGKIDKIGTIDEDARIILDAEGAVVSPGFIDIHMHEEEYSLTGNGVDIAIPMLQMGVTTAVTGNCGNNRQDIRTLREVIKKRGNPVHYMSYVGHNSLRVRAGNDTTLEASTPQQIEMMRRLANEEIEAGALGISFGFEYSPGTSMEEVLGVTQDLKGRRDILLSAHYRFDGERALESVEEMANICRLTKIPFQISHISSMSAFGNMQEALDLITKFREEEGLDLMIDAYPYAAFSTRIGTEVFAPGCFERWGKSWEDILLTEPPYEDQPATKESFEDARKNYPEMLVVAKVMREEEITLAFQHPLVMVASDGIYRNHKGHPRGAGTFPRFIGKYLRDEIILDFFEGMKKITRMPARRLRLHNKGEIKEGYDADITLFHYDTVIDRADFGSTSQEPPEGIEAVIIDGKLALHKGKLIDATAGRYLTRT